MRPHVRQKFVVGNWKMHTTTVEAQQLARGVVDGLAAADHVTVILCPPFPYLALVGDSAFTGEVSPTMLRDLGCEYVILGHSERRHKLGESEQFINRKVVCALAAGLDVILCVGETLEQRESKQTEAVLDRQLSTGIAGVSGDDLSHLSIAYEPVWAIGNDEHHATPKQAHDAHLLIRRKLSEICGETWAHKMTIQYGGSVEPKNAAAFLGQPGIDGVLIGGASLKADEFLAITKAAASEIRAEMQLA